MTTLFLDHPLLLLFSLFLLLTATVALLLQYVEARREYSRAVP